MIYFFYGGVDERIKKIEEKKRELEKKYPSASVSIIEGENFSVEKLDEIASSTNLFSGVSIFLIKNALDSKEQKDLFKKKVKILSISPNIFIISEPFITKELSTAIEKTKGEVISVSGDVGAAKRDGSVFLIADATARRDRKLAWALYQEAIFGGAVAEELHGILFWQIKNLFLAKTGISGASMKVSYPMMKAKSFAPKWEEKELRVGLSRLVSIYHEAHRGRGDLSIEIEKFLLDSV